MYCASGSFQYGGSGMRQPPENESGTHDFFCDIYRTNPPSYQDMPPPVMHNPPPYGLVDQFSTFRIVRSPQNAQNSPSSLAPPATLGHERSHSGGSPYRSGQPAGRSQDDLFGNFPTVPRVSPHGSASGGEGRNWGERRSTIALTGPYSVTAEHNLADFRRSSSTMTSPYSRDDTTYGQVELSQQWRAHEAPEPERFNAMEEQKQRILREREALAAEALKRLEEEQRQRREEEERKRKQEEERRKREEEERIRRQMEQEQRRLAEERRKQGEEEARIRQEVEKRVREAEEKIKQETLRRLAEEERLRQEQIQREIREREARERREREEAESKRKQEFEAMWQQREQQWRDEQERRKAIEEQSQQRKSSEEAYQQQLKKRLEQEQSMLQQAREKFKREMTEQVQMDLEKKRREEEKERMQREEQLQKLLQEEKVRLERLEQELLKKREKEERLIKEQEQESINQAIAQLRSSTKGENREHVEERVKKDLKATFKQKAVERNRKFEEDREMIATRQEQLSTDSWQISAKDIELGQSIGRGAFGEVFKAKLHGKEVAVKKLNVQHVDDATLDEFRQEVKIMSSLHHPNILLFMGACMEPNNYMIVMEFMSMGSLQDILFTRRANLSFKQRIKILKEVALAMNWLHSLNPPFLHRDLKSANILLDQNMNVKIADFGMSCVKCLDADGERVEGPIGSPFYMAPEVLLENPGGPLADVFSFSIVMWETIANQEPYVGMFEEFEEVVEAITMDEERPPILEWFPVGVKKLLQKCWAADAECRPSFKQMLGQSWFDHILVDYVIHDAVASAFWKTYFLEKDSCSWGDFFLSFTQFCQLQLPPKSIEARLLKSIVAKNNSSGMEMVTIEDFAQLTSWFGPLKKGQETALMQQLIGTLKSPWFHGHMASAQADVTLKSLQRPGLWLVRFGKIDRGNKFMRNFTLSVLGQDMQVHHYNIQQDPNNGVLHFNQRQFPTWGHFVPCCSQALGFNPQTPCPGSPYQALLS